MTQVRCWQLVHTVNRVWTIGLEQIPHQTCSVEYLLSHHTLNIMMACDERALYVRDYDDVRFVPNKEPVTCLTCIACT